MKTKLFISIFCFISFFAQSQDPQKTLSDAITSGMLDNVKIAVEQQNADVNKVYKDKIQNNYPIHAACQLINIEIVQYLLDKGAEVSSENRFGQTPLITLCYSFMGDTASTRKSLAIIDLLVAKGAELDVVGGGGHTAIAYAAERNKLEFVKKLIALKADVNKRGKSKISYTPLMNAAKLGNLEMVKALVEAGAEINEIREHADGSVMITENAASMASDGNFSEVLEYLKTKGAKAPKGRKIWK
ncbi:MAG: hypothetical protein A2033_13485 [Bacteroidetes bacterium GWA2_31_9]|nr:MAG: hypothetical protein A2033_13485 [Bacteroidetes bacterium GWA2_31_9]